MTQWRTHAMRPPHQRHHQRGQALVYGVALLLAGLAALMFLFNVGQLTAEKTKLVTTADAVAYSAGVMHARALNYQAYTNRAMLANTVAIAQLVSLSSWVHYVGNMATFGWELDNPKFSLNYPSYAVALSAGMELETSLNDSEALEKLAQASDQIIQRVLVNSQTVVNSTLAVAALNVMKEVAQANYLNDGSVNVVPLPSTSLAYNQFIQRYSGEQRTRFAEVAQVAANRDAFVPKRSWFFPGLWSDCPGATVSGRVDFLTRRGGTELVNFDQWQARDTLSEKRWVPANKFDITCAALAESPVAWGQTVAAKDETLDYDPEHYDASLIINPSPTVIAMVDSDSWGYSGLPSFYDLSNAQLASGDPRLRHAVVVTRSIPQTTTSEGRSAIRNTPRINAYQANALGNVLTSVASSEVFFERNGAFIDNAYGQSAFGKPREIGSLFNPFWQVHLIQPTTEQLTEAMVLQGATPP